MAESSDKDASYSSKEEPTTAGQPLSDFLLQLEDYTPTVFSLFFILNYINSKKLNIKQVDIKYFFSYLMPSRNTTYVREDSIQQMQGCKFKTEN